MKKLSAFLVAILVFCASCEKTIVSPTFRPKRFRAVTVGSSLDKVIQELGPPLRILKYSRDPRSNPLPSGALYESLTVSQARKLAEDTNAYLVLSYSLQGDARK